MSVFSLLRRAALAATLGLGALLPFTASQAAEPYVTLEPAQPSDTTGKIEVLEFFAYTCPHCNAIEPMLQKWAKTLPENVVLKYVPVAFNASMTDLQKLFYSLESMNRLDLHDKVFDAIHNQRKRIYTADAIADWAQEQGLDRKAFTDVFNSFGIQTKVNRANELVKAYKIEGTPSIAVGGKYVTSPSMTGSYEGTITQAQKLVDMMNKK
jgi:thiol:disulfide interchange protein DsbA